MAKKKKGFPTLTPLGGFALLLGFAGAFAVGQAVFARRPPMPSLPLSAIPQAPQALPSPKEMAGMAPMRGPGRGSFGDGFS